MASQVASGSLHGHGLLHSSLIKTSFIEQPCFRLPLWHQCSNSTRFPWWRWNPRPFTCDANDLTTQLKVQTASQIATGSLHEVAGDMTLPIVSQH